MRPTISPPMPPSHVYNGLRHWRLNSMMGGSETVKAGEDFAAGFFDDETPLVLVDFMWLRDQIGVTGVAAGMIGDPLPPGPTGAVTGSPVTEGGKKKPEVVE